MSYKNIHGFLWSSEISALRCHVHLGENAIFCRISLLSPPRTAWILFPCTSCPSSQPSLLLTVPVRPEEISTQVCPGLRWASLSSQRFCPTAEQAPWAVAANHRGEAWVAWSRGPTRAERGPDVLAAQMNKSHGRTLLSSSHDTNRIQESMK